MSRFSCPKCGSYYDAEVAVGSRVECDTCGNKFPVPQCSIVNVRAPAVRNLIFENPFRILGVYSNSSGKVLSAAQARAKAFLKVGKLLSYPVDCGLPLLRRTDESVQHAGSLIALPLRKMVYACLWFMEDDTPIGRAFFRAVAESDLKKARRLIERAGGEIAVTVNYAVIKFWEKDYNAWLKTIARIFDSSDEWRTFTEQVCGASATVSPDECGRELLALVREYLDEGSLSDTSILTGGGIFGKIVENNVKQKCVALSAALNKGDAAQRFAEAERCLPGVSPLIEALGNVRTRSVGLQRAIDTLADDMLQTSIDLVNKNRGNIPLLERSQKLLAALLTWPLGSLAFQRLQDSAETLKKNIAFRKENEAFERVETQIFNIVNAVEHMSAEDAVSHLYMYRDDVKNYLVRLGEIAEPSQREAYEEVKGIVATIFFGMAAKYVAEIPVYCRSSDNERKCYELLHMTKLWTLPANMRQVRDVILGQLESRVHPTPVVHTRSSSGVNIRRPGSGTYAGGYAAPKPSMPRAKKEEESSSFLTNIVACIAIVFYVAWRLFPLGLVIWVIYSIFTE